MCRTFRLPLLIPIGSVIHRSKKKNISIYYALKYTWLDYTLYSNQKYRGWGITYIVLFSIFQHLNYLSESIINVRHFQEFQLCIWSLYIIQSRAEDLCHIVSVKKGIVTRSKRRLFSKWLRYKSLKLVESEQTHKFTKVRRTHLQATLGQ